MDRVGSVAPWRASSSEMTLLTGCLLGGVVVLGIGDTAQIRQVTVVARTWLGVHGRMACEELACESLDALKPFAAAQPPRIFSGGAEWRLYQIDFGQQAFGGAQPMEANFS